MLKFLQGLNAREVATIIGKTDGAVDALQHRGLIALRKALKVEQGPGAKGQAMGNELSNSNTSRKADTAGNSKAVGALGDRGRYLPAPRALRHPGQEQGSGDPLGAGLDDLLAAVSSTCAPHGSSHPGQRQGSGHPLGAVVGHRLGAALDAVVGLLRLRLALAQAMVRLAQRNERAAPRPRWDVAQ